jgi:hypothetical protein
MADEECTLNWASVWIRVLAAQHFDVVIIIVVVDGTVECQQNHLRNLNGKEERKTLMMMSVIFHVCCVLIL